MKKLLVIGLAAMAILGGCKKSSAPFRLDGLQVEYMETPLGIDVAEPRFSWKMVSEKYGQRQEACRIDVWEAATGKTV